MTDRMDSSTAPAQELVEHGTRVSAAALSARLKAVEADLEALLPLAQAAVRWVEAQDEGHTDGAIWATDELDRLIRALPPELRRRLMA